MGCHHDPVATQGRTHNGRGADNGSPLREVDAMTPILLKALGALALAILLAVAIEVMERWGDSP